MDKSKYTPRIIDDEVEEYLAAFGAICVEGPKWYGKTWTSAYHANSEFMVGDPANDFQNRKMAVMSPAVILEGAALNRRVAGSAANMRRRALRSRPPRR